MDSNSDIEFDLCVGVRVRASVRACVRSCGCLFHAIGLFRKSAICKYIQNINPVIFPFPLDDAKLLQCGYASVTRNWLTNRRYTYIHSSVKFGNCEDLKRYVCKRIWGELNKYKSTL